MMKAVEPLQKAISEVVTLKDQNRPSPLYSHLCMIADGIPALGWVLVTPTPVPYITEMKEASLFFGNRVVKEWKDKDVVHVEWVGAFKELLSGLGGYVKSWHTTGMAWKAGGVEFGRSQVNLDSGSTAVGAGNDRL